MDWSVLFNGQGRTPVVPLGPHLLSAALYGEINQDQKGRSEVDTIREISPGLSLERWRRTSPYKDPAMTARFLHALAKGGLK
ncbi:MAG TPA: hypothetical protein VGX03_29550 [Candidatus Binatia bacterium]|jgi:hypothetical protein|nr:hypothetical protein [Candidatus Binatia bacterium]